MHSEKMKCAKVPIKTGVSVWRVTQQQKATNKLNFKKYGVGSKTLYNLV